MDAVDVIESEEDLVDLPSGPLLPDPLVIKGTGNMTVFGMNSRWDSNMPTQLNGKVAPEEFNATMRRLNAVLRKNTPVTCRWLCCGCLFCCCTLGCSLWPVVCLSKRTLKSLDKAIDYENHRLYLKLGMRWKLSRRRCDSSNMSEYVLLIEFLPKAPLLLPD